MIELVVPFSASGGSVVSVNGKMGVVVLTPEDIGALPEGALEGYATEQYVQEQIENIEHPTTDLTGYATETYVKEQIAEAQLSGGEDVDLSAYATKQYVSEQVNAIELMPGPAGPQGPKGQDGYTPVKGVDYFDGQPGKDGYTPIKGVDYFDGEPGVPGEPGADYVLTEADKQEIAGMVEVSGGDVDLSDYYTKSEVDELIEAIPSTPGTGGSVNIDNATIIEEDGVIKTAVGGYIGTGPEQLYYWADENGIADNGGKITIDTVGVSNAATIFKEAMNGTRVINYKLTHAASAGGEITEYEGTGTVYTASGGYRYTLDVGIGDNASIHVYAIGEAFVYMWLQGVLYSFELYTPDVSKAIPIDNAFIDTEYVATRDYVNECVAGYATTAYVEELIGGIENGSY